MAKRRGRIVVAVALLGTLAAVMPATAARATTALDPLPFSQLAGMVADSHGHVFVTAGFYSPQTHAGNEVWVYDTNGHYQTTIPGEPAASGLVLSGDGQTLYVADAGAARISAVSTSTLTEVAQYPTPPGSCPSSLALVGTNLWFADECDTNVNATIASVSTVGAPAQALSTPTFYRPLLRSVPGDPASLVVGERDLLVQGQQNARLTRLDVSGAPAVVAAAVLPHTAGLADMALTSTGSDVVLASFRPSAAPAVKTSDFSTDGSYSADLMTMAVATTVASGGLLAVGVSSTVPTVDIYRQGVAEPVARFSTGTVDPLTGAGDVTPGGLAWSPAGDRLFVVTGMPYLHLQVIVDPTQPSTTITAAAPTPQDQGAGGLATGTVTRGAVPVAGESLTVWYQDPTMSSTLEFGSVVTDANGAFSFSTAIPGFHSPVAASVEWTVVDSGPAGVLVPSQSFTVVLNAPPPPGPPTAVYAVAGRGGVQIGFTEPAPNSYFNPTSYVVFRGTSPTTLTPLPTFTFLATAYGWDANPVIGARSYYAVAAVNVSGQGPLSATVSAVPWTASDQGTFATVSPVRLLDTRAHAPIGPHGVATVQVAAQGGHGSQEIPSNATAAVINLTATGASVPTYLTAFATGQPRPSASAINVVPGQTVANLVTVPLGVGGQVDIYNASGSVNAIVDVIGFYADSFAANSRPQGAFHPVVPQRVADTRVSGLPLAGNEQRTFSYPIAPQSDGHETALLLNVTVVSPQTSGYLAVPPSNASPTTSILNFTPGHTVSNAVIVPARSLGPNTAAFALINASAGSVHVVVDLVGWYDDLTLADGLRFHVVTSTRIVDSRVGTGVASALGPGQQRAVALPAGLGTANTAAVVMNVTAVSPSAATFVSLWPDGLGMPASSFLNPARGLTTAGMVTTGLGTLTRSFDVFNRSGSTQVLADLTGYFDGTLPLGAQ